MEYEGCEYRIVEGHTSNPQFLPPGFTAAASTAKPMCGAKLKKGDIPPTCELPDLTDKNCPIALYALGKITLLECNEKLTQIFAKKRKN